MTDSVRRFVVGRDRAVTRQILALTAVLTVTAFSTLAIPAVWAEYASASGAETMRLATAAAFLLSVIAAVYLLSVAGGINPYVPTAAVFVVLTVYAVTGVGTGSQLVFFVGPSIFLGILAALSAYANDGAVASLSVVFFPVFGYMINAPYGIAAGLSTVNRIRFALVFSLLFTFSIGIAGFLVGSTIRRVVDYGGFVTVEDLIDADEYDTESVVETVVDAEFVESDTVEASSTGSEPATREPTDSTDPKPTDHSENVE